MADSPLCVVDGKRRFTCLSPTLVRMEFAPDGVFIDRPSLVAAGDRRPLAFQSISRHTGDLTLETGCLTLISRHAEKAFFPSNLEVRWQDKGLLQYWRPGDKDHRNLGGTVRSLDRCDRSTQLSGVHTADMESPDTKATTWLAWLQCEDDPSYYQQSPEGQRPGLNSDFFGALRHPEKSGNILARSFNYTADYEHFGPGVLSRSGYFFLNDSLSPLLDDDGFPVERNRPGYQDWYFFAYGEDYRVALADFMRLSGKAPLPTRAAMGLMYCRWPAFGAEEARTIADEFASHGLPLSALIVDMEWHKEGWGHWEWNPGLFPDPKAFFDWAHERGLEIALNDHPLDLRGDDKHFTPFLERTHTSNRLREKEYNNKTVPMVDINLGEKSEAQAFSEICHKHILDAGLDWWWNDGCRGQLDGAINQLLANKLFFEEARHNERRGMLLARWGGLGSHRYGVTFTGDALSCWEILKIQCEYNIRAGHVGQSYISHDIGGFYSHYTAPLIDPELFVRWVQFGAFSPICRFHSCPGSGSRKPWDYGETIGKTATRWLQTRHTLMPHLYTAARVHHDTGLPIVRGMFLDQPNEELAYRFDQYMLGDGLLVAPILDTDLHRNVYLPPGDWYDFGNGKVNAGGRLMPIQAGLGSIPAYVRAGTILVRQPVEAPAVQGHIESLWLDLYPGAQGVADLYEDDGRSEEYLRDGFCTTRFELSGPRLTGSVTHGRPLGKTRQIKVELVSDRAPSDAVINGRQKLTWEPGTKGRYRVTLPPIPSDQPFILEWK
jgi:hypothetical protein